MKKYATMTGLYSLSHFIVDFSCAFLIFSRLSGSDEWIICLFTYNFFAFAMQMPLGLLADRIKKNRHFAFWGCIFILVSPLLGAFSVIFCAVAGFGNALFHIGAGRDVLCGSEKRYSALGVFVSPGAIGLYLGMLCGKSGAMPLLAVLALLLAAAAAIVFAIPSLYDDSRMKDEPFSLTCSNGKVFIFMLLCLFLVVCMRSYVGMTLSFPWKSEESFALVLIIFVVLGKALGGFLADRFGALKVSFITLFLCAFLFLFYKIPWCGILAVFLFNMTMPITLGAVAKIMPSAMGFGFGLLTFGLFLGVLPVLLGVPSVLQFPYGFTVAAIISAILLYYGLEEPSYAA